jgi:hypothetical protein
MLSVITDLRRLDFLNWPNWQASPPISRMVMV